MISPSATIRIEFGRKKEHVNLSPLLKIASVSRRKPDELMFFEAQKMCAALLIVHIDYLDDDPVARPFRNIKKP